jgi:hypothetical protein
MRDLSFANAAAAVGRDELEAAAAALRRALVTLGRTEVSA